MKLLFKQYAANSTVLCAGLMKGSDGQSEISVFHTQYAENKNVLVCQGHNTLGCYVTEIQARIFFIDLLLELMRVLFKH